MDPEWNEGDGAIDDRPALSPAGEARREAMLRDLKAAVTRRRRQRMALRVAALGGAACLLLAAVLPGRPEAPRRWPAAGEAVRTERPAPLLELANARLEMVRDSAGILERVAVGDRPISPSTFTDDEGLLASLAAAERPAGLVRFEGGVVVAYHGGARPDAADSAPR
jgi:hypothetical protein